MAWWLLPAISAGSSLISSLTSGSAADKASMAKNKAAQAQWGQQINQINLERAASRQRTAAALFNIDVQSDTAKGEVQLQSAAAGVMGASVKDALATVDTVADSQKADAYQTEATQMETLAQQVKAAGYNASAQQTGSSQATAGLEAWGLGAATDLAKGYLGGTGDAKSFTDLIASKLGL